jgi:hypothetical protein
MRLSEFLRRDSDLVYEVGTALGTPGFFVVRAAPGGGPPQLLGHVLGCVLGRGVDPQTGQQLPHAFHCIEQALGNIVAFATRTVVGPLCLVPSSIRRSISSPSPAGDDGSREEQPNWNWNKELGPENREHGMVWGR